MSLATTTQWVGPGPIHPSTTIAAISVGDRPVSQKGGTAGTVGSYNFDPRSANLNTELGFIIDSPSLARQIETAFKDSIPASAYEVCLGAKGRLYWLEHRGGRQIYHEREPETGFWKRGIISLLSKLPIEWLL